MPKTLFEKIWDSHVVSETEDQPTCLYIDLHLVHEVTSPQAFDGLRIAGRPLRRPNLTIATADHNVQTTDRSKPIEDEISRRQVELLTENCKDFGVKLFGMNSPGQGIVHVIGPQMGYTQPGMTIVCGDSHTSTHGAFGALAMGIGTSEVEHVMATQTLLQRKPKTMEIKADGELPFGVRAKDLILAIIGAIGVDGASGHAVEYRGAAISGLSMEGRMTVCNMTIEGGGRAGMIAPDDTTIEYLEGRTHVPSGSAFQQAADAWLELGTDKTANYDKTVEIDASTLEPHVTWGTNPGQVMGISGSVPDPLSYGDPGDQDNAARALEYMALEAGTPMTEIMLDRVFIGSCTNARIEDLRAASKVVLGRRVAPSVSAMVVPGSTAVKLQAEKEGLDTTFRQAGFEWREAGCSMCLGMNPDILMPGERCASTSNRNFEGRQGKGGRTHLVGPEMAAASAIAGRFVDIRKWDIDL